MKYIINPMELVSPLGNCTCGINYANDSCNKCTKCSGYCGTFEVCVTPTGAKVSPEGINPKL
ncbi:hypothetical protein [Tissierella sp.]|uniref:hypothetical protein n=1 Tax=Tissierella sp. TaxID=41274 RepID=UPI0028643FC3|nr:hypothetical protein [Tissierella sp.]MDR7856497.1 hypothetical protein [Tissierella sp.]